MLDPEALEAASHRLMALWEPPRKLTVSQWAREEYWITMGSRRGLMEPDPFQIEIMDAVCDPEVKEIIFLKPTQVGWSTICNAATFWAISLGMDVLMVQPSVETAEKYVKDRIDPAIEACPGLRDLLVVATNRTRGSTTRNKYFRNGGSLFVASGTAPKELRSFSTPFIILDERSAFDADIGGEGDPGKIARARGDVFDELKVLEGSTPAKPRGLDPVENRYDQSSKALYHVPCPHCGIFQPLLWRDPEDPKTHLLKFEMDERKKIVPGSVAYLCRFCGALIPESRKVDMIRRGRWVHEHPEIRGIRGYRLNSLYAVSRPIWEMLAQEWVDAQGSPGDLKSFINLRLAETFQEDFEALDTHALRRRAMGEWEKGSVPEGAGVLVVFVDVQKTYLEAFAWGFGAEGKAWLVDWERFHAELDCTERGVWDELDEWLLRERFHATSGRRMGLDLVLVDSGAWKDAVYDYVLPRQTAARRVFASKGDDAITKPGLAMESSSKKNRVRLFVIDTMAAKRKALSALGRMEQVSLPAWATDELLDQLASERLETVVDKRTRKVSYRWVKTRERNEAWDGLVGAMAGLWILQNLLAPTRYRDPGTLARKANRPTEGEGAGTVVPAPAASRRRGQVFSFFKD